MTVRAVIGLRAAICVIVVTLCLAAGQGVAEDVTTGGEVAWPSLEERALPMDANTSEPKKPTETAAGNQHPRGDVPDDRIGSESGRFAA